MGIARNISGLLKRAEVSFGILGEDEICCGEPARRIGNEYLFETIAEVQDFASRWLWTYNHERPNMGLGGITPKQKLALVA